jgi:hypothetical protein
VTSHPVQHTRIGDSRLREVAIVSPLVVTFGGNYVRGKARDRRAEKQARDSAIADLLTTSVELALGVNAVRAAHQHRTSARARLMVAAALLRDLPNLESWKDLTASQ